jgi:hypothetical protein
VWDQKSIDLEENPSSRASTIVLHKTGYSRIESAYKAEEVDLRHAIVAEKSLPIGYEGVFVKVQKKIF